MFRLRRNRQHAGSACNPAGAPDDLPEIPATSQERISERTQIIDVAVPENPATFPQKRTAERTQIIDVPLPQNAENIPEEVETIHQERIWCISEDVPVPREPPDAGDDAASLQPPDGVAGALAWLSSRPARSEQRPVQHTGHGYRLRWAHEASPRW